MSAYITLRSFAGLPFQEPISLLKVSSALCLSKKFIGCSKLVFRGVVHSKWFQ
ncbi:hypothetical protein D051_4106 [Vibrio parahaemolyticus VPCR-2010]|nr:hypothetical protein D051_4106 [Vibrio parahaemolyticus VPCR-2010]